MRLRHIYENISNGNNAFCVSVKQQDLVCGARLKNRLIFMSRLEELANSLFGEMRDMTPEESKACRESISKISSPTGVNFYDLMGIPSACRNCGNHPVNGGSGICQQEYNKNTL